MSVNPKMPKETIHLSYELRFLEIEAGLKKHKELLEKFSSSLMKSGQIK